MKTTLLWSALSGIDPARTDEPGAMRPVQSHEAAGRYRWWLIALCVLALAAVPVSAKRLKGKVSNGRYTTPRELFSVKVPESTNWAGVPYEIQEQTEKKHGNYDLVAFYVKDFGQVLIASVRWIPQVALDAMARDDPENVLRNHADKALFDWRPLPEEPQVLDESFGTTPFGKSVLRVYNLPKGSLMEKNVGGSGRGFEHFDVAVSVKVVMRDDHYIYAIAEDDSAPMGKEKLVARLESFFGSLEVPDSPRFTKK